MMESVSDLERDGNDLRMNIVKQPEDDEEESDDGEDQNADEEANDDEDGIEDEVDRQNMRSEDENDGDNEDADESEREDEDEREAEDEAIAEIKDCSKSSDMCQMDVQPVGCYKDLTNNVRTLPKLLVSYRDNTSHAFSRFFKWKMGEVSIKKLLCECVEKARKMGMSYISLQFYGECWSSKTAAIDYGKQGKSTNCVNGTYKACTPGEFCVGKAKTNYVYAINSLLQKPCKLKYKNVGCFHDPVNVSKRPLPYLLENRRDNTSHTFKAKYIDWKNYHASLSDLVCSCATKAHAKGYKYFGIQYFGECWSGPGSTSYKVYGGANVCKSAAFQKCNVGTRCRQCLCTGDQHSNYVYQLG